MEYTELDSQKSATPWFSVSDARTKSLVNQSQYHPARVVCAEGMKVLLGYMYPSAQVTITYRQKWASIKVHAPVESNHLMVSRIEKEWRIQGVTKVMTPQGIIYRMPRIV